MATIATGPAEGRNIDHLSGTDRAHGLDRWIFVLMAALYIVITLTGFIPDSLMKIELVKAGLRAPFPPILHAHAVLMGSFLLLFLGQAYWVATGQQARHERIGPWLGVLAVALIVVGFILAPTMYHQVWGALQAAPPEAQAQLAEINRFQDNILLLQMNVGLMFTILIGLGFVARRNDPGFHKRVMVMAPAMPLPAAIDRITWLPHTVPASSLSASLYPLLVLVPLIVWDVIRNGRVHRAYWVMLAVYVPTNALIFWVWDTPWWHATARHLMGV